VVWATDIDERAVALAGANVARFGLEERVFVDGGDLLEPVPAPLDLIVANLPYLPASLAGRHPELAGEPFDAVFAADDGLDSYRRLIPQAAAKLAASGTLLLQLYGDVLAAERSELPALRDYLEAVPRAALAA
jgi:release factor glutamine methyltransferase